MKQLTTTPTALATVRGSIQQIAIATGKPLAKVLLGINAVLIIDTSSSMMWSSGEANKSRYEVACSELAKLQATIPGKVALVSFGDDVAFCPGGQPPAPSGGTKLTEALEFCKRFDIGQMKFVLISDGEPNNSTTALEVARTYCNTIHTVYVGSDRNGFAEKFLAQLALVSGGQALEAHNVVGLMPAMERLLTVSY